MLSKIVAGHIKPDLQEWDSVLLLAKRKPSAVAVVMIEAHSEDSKLLLIRRSVKSSSHKGQIGFPGGRYEQGDERPSHTALRELFEEVGLAAVQVKVLGTVDHVTSIDGSIVVPVICQVDFAAMTLAKNSDEVDDIHLVSLKSVLNDNRQEFKFNLFGCWRHSFLYDCGAVSIWGLSAEILARANFHKANLKDIK